METIGLSEFRRIGYCPAVATGEYAVSAIAAAYVFPTAAMQMEVVSSSANDAAAGTGARTVEIGYLDSNYVEKKEVVTLNGITAVATTATDIFRVNSFRVLTAGSGSSAAGKIDLRNLADTPIYSTIAIGEIESRQIVFTVPAGQRLRIDEMYLSNVAATALKYCTFSLKNNIAAGSLLFEILFSTSLDQDSMRVKPVNPIFIPEKRDVKLVVKGVAAGIATATVYGVIG